MSEPQYVNGLYPKPKSDAAPSFVIGKLSINVAQFREWMQGYLKDNPDAEWINIDMKRQKANPEKGSAVLDTWKPEKQAEPEPQGGDYDDSIPFGV